TLASTYNASPESTRKAFNVLVDLGIMEVRDGSGALVASKEKAKDFLLQYQEVQSIQDTKAEFMASVEKQQDELNHFSQ
ncbi:GntR family transcriptional regulator, partial [Enterococcus faecium]